MSIEIRPSFFRKLKFFAIVANVKIIPSRKKRSKSRYNRDRQDKIKGNKMKRQILLTFFHPSSNLKLLGKFSGSVKLHILKAIARKTFSVFHINYCA